jgi:hypothetical protein
MTSVHSTPSPSGFRASLSSLSTALRTDDDQTCVRARAHIGATRAMSARVAQVSETRS